MILKDYTLACFIANTKIPNNIKRRFRSIEWENASDEQRKNLLFLEYNGKKTALIPLTKEEREEEDYKDFYRKNKVYKFLLENYNWKYAHQYAIDNKLEEKLIPHCKYIEDNQCDLFCPFFDICGCSYYKGE